MTPEQVLSNGGFFWGKAAARLPLEVLSLLLEPGVVLA